jgi:hypothetical protein
MDRNEFSGPGLEYRGVTLWMLNDKLEREEIAKQMDDFHNAGWGALITRTFNGLRTPYLSEEWMEITQEIIERAGTYGIKVWLQAGYMPSAIPELEDGYTHKVLVRKLKDEPAEDGETLVHEEGDYAYYHRLFGHVLDLLSAEAVRDYLHKAYEIPWWDRFGEAFGKTVETVWVDEPHFRPPLLPWNDELPRVFAQRWGYSLTDQVPALYAPVGDFCKVRHHYWRIVVDMFMSAYFEQIGRWCEEHRVKFGGHAMGEDSLYRQISWTGAAMRCYEHMQLPGIDHLTLSLTWPNDCKFVLTPKQCASAANQLGRAEILAEMYGVSSQRISFEERKLIGDWLELLGINYRCYHGSFYSMRGVRKRIYAPHLSYQQPWWPDNRLIADYFARLSYALRQGDYQADVLVVHPVESAFCVFDPTYEEEPPRRVLGRRPPRPLGPLEMEALNQSLQQVSEILLELHRGFEYGDEHLMELHGKVVADGLAVGKMTYKVVLLPSVITLRRSTVDLLHTFIDQGGTVLAVGQLPTRMDGVGDGTIDALNRRVRKVKNTVQALEGALDELAPADVEIVATDGDAANVWVHQRRLEEGRLFFLANTARVEGLETGTRGAVEAEVRVRGSGKLEEWDLRTGQVMTPPQHRRVHRHPALLPAGGLPPPGTAGRGGPCRDPGSEARGQAFQAYRAPLPGQAPGSECPDAGRVSLPQGRGRVERRPPRHRRARDARRPRVCRAGDPPVQLPGRGQATEHSGGHRGCQRVRYQGERPHCGLCWPALLCGPLVPPGGYHRSGAGGQERDRDLAGFPAACQGLIPFGQPLCDPHRRRARVHLSDR